MSVAPSRSFSQNFLTNEATQKKTVSALTTSPESLILEIGPGTGALTQHLIHSQASSLWLVEYDPRCIAHLSEHFLYTPHVRIFHEDILCFDWDTIPEKTPLHIIGSLPYHITSPILLRTIKAPNLQEAVFIVQKEVGLRVIAKPCTKAYGRLSIILQLLCTPSLVDIIPAEDFDPVPKVTSCILHLKPHTTCISAKDLKDLQHLTNLCFQQRRKQLRNTLKHFFPHFQEVADALSIDTQARPETLCPQTFLRLSQKLNEAS